MCFSISAYEIKHCVKKIIGEMQKTILMDSETIIRSYRYLLKVIICGRPQQNYIVVLQSSNTIVSFMNFYTFHSRRFYPFIRPSAFYLFVRIRILSPFSTGKIKLTFSLTNHVAEFSLSLRVARTNSPTCKYGLYPNPQLASTVDLA